MQPSPHTSLDRSAPADTGQRPAVPTTDGDAPPIVLARGAWEPRAEAHARRIGAVADPHLARRARGEKHPVEDFLWVYYRWRPAEIARWHPGVGVALADAGERATWKDHRPLTPAEREAAGWTGRGGASIPATVDVEAFMARRGQAVERWHLILQATAGRTGRFGCFGLHEWAMVHGIEADDRRHGGVPLRLGREGTDAVTESHTITCSHFDAYRFFTDSSRDLNTLRPGPEDRTAFEQPGCLHATMDLYKVAATLGPLVPGELLADCLDLARDVRELDMRASPYDLRGWGYEPVRIETPEGKAAYVAAQRGFSERGQHLRARLLQVTSRALRGV